MTAMGGALLVVISHFPTSPRPEKAFLRQCRRFFRQAGFLMSELALDGKPKRDIAGRLKAILYRGDLLEVPGKLALCGKKIDHRAFPANTADQVQALVSRFYLLAYQIKDLAAAHRYPQAESLLSELGADLRAFCSLIEKRFQLWADDPTAAVATSGEARAQMMALSTKFSDRLDATFRLVDGEKA